MIPHLPWRALPPALTPVPPGRVFQAVRGASPDAITALADWLAPHLQLPEVLLCDSGTSALRLALEQLAGPGPVALPAFGCFDLATAAIGAGVSVRFYDVDPATLTPDLDDVAAVIRQGVRALVVAGVYGYPPPMPALRTLCDAAGIALVEDIAQGAGARWGGQPLGRWGDAVILSFGRGKGIGGAGGGACGFRVPRSAPRPLAPTDSSAGRRGAAALLLQQLLGHPALFALPSALPWLHLGATRYHAPWPPRAIHPIQAFLARDGLRGMPGAREARASVAHAMQAAFARRQPDSSPVVSALPDGQPGYLRLAIRTTGMHAIHQQFRLLEQAGGRRVYPLLLPELPALHPMMVRGVDIGTFSGAREIVDHVMTVPTHHHVTPDDMAAVVAACTWGA